MPLTAGKLRRLVKSKHPYIEHNLGTVVAIIRSAVQNAQSFEDAAELLRERAGMVRKISNANNFRIKPPT